MRNWLFFLFLIPFASCGQKEKLSLYDEKDYIEKKRGTDNGFPFVIVYVNQKDTNYALKKNYYFDSTFSGDSYNKTFYYKGIANGPYVSVVDGQVTSKGTYINNNYTGERLSYTNGVLTQKAYYDNGIKVGKWEEYNESGNLIRTMNFDDRGNLIKIDKK